MGLVPAFASAAGEAAGRRSRAGASLAGFGVVAAGAPGASSAADGGPGRPDADLGAADGGLGELRARHRLLVRRAGLGFRLVPGLGREAWSAIGRSSGRRSPTRRPALRRDGGGDAALARLPVDARRALAGAALRRRVGGGAGPSCAGAGAGVRLRGMLRSAGCRRPSLWPAGSAKHAGMRSSLEILPPRHWREPVLLPPTGLSRRRTGRPTAAFSSSTVTAGSSAWSSPSPRLTEIDTGFAKACNNDHGISPDGRVLVISDGTATGSLHLHPADRGRQAPAGDRERPSYWHGWSPDGGRSPSAPSATGPLTFSPSPSKAERRPG